MLISQWMLILLLSLPFIAIVLTLFVVYIYITYAKHKSSYDKSKPSKFEQTACITKDEHTTWLGSNPRRK